MMPKFIGNDSLIARVNEVEGCMYRQSNELGRLNKAIKKYKDENAKLREVCLDAHEWMSRVLYDGSARRYEYELITERMRELGVEVD